VTETAQSITLPRNHALKLSPDEARLRWRAVREIGKQEIRLAVFSWPLYVTATAGVLLATLLIYNIVRYVSDSGLEIVSRPFYSPMLVALSLATIYLSGWAALAIARPREQGSLRVLFFAPVHASSLIGAHLLAALAMYALIVLMTIPLMLVLSAIVNLPFPPNLLLGVALSPTLVAPAIAIGLCVSAVAPSGRSAALIFGLVLAILLAVQLGSNALMQIPPASRYYDALLFLREALAALRNLLNWLSPLALLSSGLDAAYRANWTELVAYVVAGLVGCAVWSALAIWALMQRGVLP
jgi:ABC-type transport system involved in multi-copper enzyme maturation permease subunit